jgi:hypothetical protein
MTTTVPNIVELASELVRIANTLPPGGAQVASQAIASAMDIAMLQGEPDESKLEPQLNRLKLSLQVLRRSATISSQLADRLDRLAGFAVEDDDEDLIAPQSIVFADPGAASRLQRWPEAFDMETHCSPGVPPEEDE